MEFITKYKPFAEFLYFLSWPITLIAALAVIYQIIEFRKEARTRFTRETISTTLEVLDRKIKSLEALTHAAFTKDDARNIPQQGLVVEGYCKSKVKCDPSWLKWYFSEEGLEFRNDIIDTLNEFETLAHYIYSGIVDEDLCYNLESFYILTILKDLQPFIALSIDEEHSGLYKNLVKLHTNWTQRFSLDETTKNHDELTRTLAKMPNPKTQKVIT